MRGKDILFLSNTYHTRPEQSNPLVVTPPHLYGIPSKCSAVSVIFVALFLECTFLLTNGLAVSARYFFASTIPSAYNFFAF